MLHDEILHKIFAWLPVDTYAILARVSPHWKHLTRTEAVYRRLCERVYLNQNKQCQLNVSVFGGSYRTMLEQRPRVRAGGGVYVQKYSQIKHIERDRWAEVSSPLMIMIIPNQLRSLAHEFQRRFLLEPLWKVRTIDTSTFKRMAKFCTL